MFYQVKASPNTKQALVIQDGTLLKVKIDAPPKEGKANKRLIEILSEHFDVPKNNIQIVSGLTSRNKIVEIFTEPK